MFCPKCGNASQAPQTYCRQCGVFLPDLDRANKPKNTPEEHAKVNAVLSFLTIIASFTMATLLYSILAFRSDTHFLIYLAAAIFLAIGAWHVQTFIRSMQLRKHFKRKHLEGYPLREEQTERTLTGTPTGKFLNEGDVSSQVPASVTETTTKHLGEKLPRSS